MAPSDFVCLNAMPGIGCGLPESFILGIVYLLTSALCLVFMVHGRIGRSRSAILEETFKIRLLFWISMFIWTLFRSITSIVPFPYNEMSYEITSVVTNDVLSLIPLSLAILIICQILFSFEDPGSRRTVFFRITFCIYLTAFLLIALVVTLANNDDATELHRSMSLWRASTNTIILLFFMLPGLQLFKTVLKYEKPEGDNRVVIAQFAITFFLLAFCVRVLYDILTYAGANPLQNYMNGENVKSKRIPPGGVRALTFLGYVFLEVVPSLLIMLAVRFLRFLESRYSEKRATVRERSNSSVLDWPLIPSSS
jgi:hypothetical protein